MCPLPLTVLILSSDRAFSRHITERWPASAQPPEFVLLEEDHYRDLRGDTFDLIIADSLSAARHAALTQTLRALGKPAIVIAPEGVRADVSIDGAVVELSRDGGSWVETVALLAPETLRRLQAESRLHEEARLRAAADADATLGRYMVEMRHSATNALTPVLGNAELLLLEPGLPASVQAQADTIRNMALRLNEIFQRFSSLEKELSVVARETGKRTDQARAASAGH